MASGTPFDDASPEVQARAAFKMAFVRAVLAKPEGVSVAAAIARDAAERGIAAHDVPPRRTVVEWVRRAEVDGIHGLVDTPHHARGRRLALEGLSERVKSHLDVDKVIRAIVVGGKGGAKELQDVLNRRLRRHGITVPYSTAARWLQNYRRRQTHLVYLAHEGVGALLDDAQFHFGWDDDVEPGRLWSFDSTPADEVVSMRNPRDPRRLDDVRPTVSRLIDVGSRVHVTFEVTIGPLTADHVLGLLRRAVVQGQNWEGLPTLPPPAVVRIDGGGEHRAVVEEALRMLGVTIDVATKPDSPPERQSHVERLHGTLNARVSASAVGRTKSARVDDGSPLSMRDTMRGRQHRAREVPRPEVRVESLRRLQDFIDATLQGAVAYNCLPHKGIRRAIRGRVRQSQSIAA